MQRDPSIPDYEQVKGPSGSGKTRMYAFKVWSENQRFESLELLLHGKQPRISLHTLGHSEPGPARRAVMVSTDTAPSPDSTIGSYLGIDRYLTDVLESSSQRCCPNCGTLFNHIVNGRDAGNVVVTRGFSRIEVVVHQRSTAPRRDFESAGYHPLPDGEGFVIDQNLNPSSDEMRIRNAVEIAFSFEDVLISCRDSLSGTKLYFSRRGACPECSTEEPLRAKQSVDLDLPGFEGTSYGSFSDTKGFLVATDDQKAWLQKWPVHGIALSDFVSGTLRSIPNFGPFEVFNRISSDLCLDELRILQLCSSLSRGELTRLGIAKGLLETAENELLVVDGASLGSGDFHIRKTAHALRTGAMTRSIVVIDNHPHFSSEIVRDDSPVESIPSQPEAGNRRHVPIDSPSIVVVTGESSREKKVWIESYTGKSSNPLKHLSTYSTAERSDLLVLEWLQLDQPLARLFGASLDAQSAGLDPRQFSRRSRLGAKNFCRTCSGLGIESVAFDFVKLPLLPCPACQGFTLLPPVSSSTYRRLTYADFLELSLGAGCALLSDVAMFAALEAPLEYLGLAHIPLGRTVNSCSEGERLRLALLQAVRHSIVPTLFHLEHPAWRLDSEQSAGLSKFLRDAVSKGHSFVIDELDNRIEADHVIAFA